MAREGEMMFDNDKHNKLCKSIVASMKENVDVLEQVEDFSLDNVFEILTKITTSCTNIASLIIRNKRSS